MNRDAVLAHRFPPIEARYGAKDLILYALGTGFGADPLDPAHLAFLYEKGLNAVPTFANVLGSPGPWMGDPAFAIALAKIVHAEQRLTLHAPLPVEGHVVSRNDVMGLRDKGEGSGAFLYQRKQVEDATTGTPLASIVSTLLLRGDGGCGDHGEAPEELTTLSEAAPDLSVEVQTNEASALIYRLSGDLNPIHIDPEVARSVGFERPILHGLATMGFACYALLKACADLDPARLKSLAVRFSKPVFPGEAVRLDIWRESATRLRFRGTVAARDAVVLDRGLAELN